MAASGRGMTLARGVTTSTPQARSSIPLVIDEPLDVPEAATIVTTLVAHKIVTRSHSGTGELLGKEVVVEETPVVEQGLVGISHEDYSEFASQEDVMAATAENPRVLDEVREAIWERWEAEARATTSIEEQERLTSKVYAVELVHELR